VMDWLLPCCCGTLNKMYKFRLNGTRATRVSQLLIDDTMTVGHHLTISNSQTYAGCTTPPTSHRTVSSKTSISGSDKLMLSGTAVLSVVLVCLIVIVVLSYKW